MNKTIEQYIEYCHSKFFRSDLTIYEQLLTKLQIISVNRISLAHTTIFNQPVVSILRTTYDIGCIPIIFDYSIWWCPVSSLNQVVSLNSGRQVHKCLLCSALFFEDDSFDLHLQKNECLALIVTNDSSTIIEIENPSSLVPMNA